MEIRSLDLFNANPVSVVRGVLLFYFLLKSFSWQSMYGVFLTIPVSYLTLDIIFSGKTQ